MRSLLLIILSLWLSANLLSQSPHGTELKINCAACHSSEGWEIDADFWKLAGPREGKVSAIETPRFQHEKTNFELTGRHALVDCRACHGSLVFSEVSSDCISCHTDIHQQTAGRDCARCHSSSNWLVDKVTELHVENGFPLFGLHASANCTDCHRSESALRFDRIGNECVNCHLEQYTATTKPNHTTGGYSTNCIDCHDPGLSDWLWRAGAANHLFFPLTKGHMLNDCSQCHTGGNFMNTPTDCIACHANDFLATTNPDHETGNFPTDCIVCHTTDPGWKTNFEQHDAQYFPIYSGKHRGEWNQCTECHTTSGNFKAFSCVDCHEHNNAGDLANEHDDVSGYSYTSMACYTCHPKGN